MCSTAKGQLRQSAAADSCRIHTHTHTVQTGYVTVTRVQSLGICVQIMMCCRHNFTLREVWCASHATLIKDQHSDCYLRASFCFPRDSAVFGDFGIHLLSRIA